MQMQDISISTPQLDSELSAPSIHDPAVEWFLTHCHIHRYPSKYTLIHAGEDAESLFYIVSGSVAVFIKDEEGKEMILSHLGQGEFVGEISLFEDTIQPRTAWVSKPKALAKLRKSRIKNSNSLCI